MPFPASHGSSIAWQEACDTSCTELSTETSWDSGELVVQEGPGQNKRPPCRELPRDLRCQSHRQTPGKQCKIRESSGLVVSQKGSWSLEKQSVSSGHKTQQPQVSLARHCRSCKGEVGRRLPTTAQADWDSKCLRCWGDVRRLPLCSALPHCSKLRAATIPSDTQAQSMRTNHMRMMEAESPFPCTRSCSNDCTVERQNC